MACWVCRSQIAIAITRFCSREFVTPYFIAIDKSRFDGIQTFFLTSLSTLETSHLSKLSNHLMYLICSPSMLTFNEPGLPFMHNRGQLDDLSLLKPLS